MGHVSVLLAEVVESFKAIHGGLAGKTVVDATFGAGGYSRALLEAGANIIGFDRDPTTKPFVEAIKHTHPDRFSFIDAPFSHMKAELNRRAIETVDGVVMDIGVSSMQLDQPSRGFSFQSDGPLDMRMGAEGETAADIVNHRTMAELSDIFHHYGDEVRARHIANHIVSRRQTKPFERTLDLASVVEKALGGRRGKATHPATKTFQALRIVVNDELSELEAGLAQGAQILAPFGRLVVVSFHSLEDRIVKNFMNEKAGKIAGVSRFVPVAHEKSAPQDQGFRLLTPKAVSASDAECAINPRARSAKLRALEKTNPHHTHPLFI